MNDNESIEKRHTCIWREQVNYYSGGISQLTLERQRSSDSCAIGPPATFMSTSARQIRALCRV